uniref:Uncharacterized protein n=1 Tax=Anguilla anguilla TaxID=7936 RepID=A0A0E9R0B0_ANGAN
MKGNCVKSALSLWRHHIGSSDHRRIAWIVISFAKCSVVL